MSETRAFTDEMSEISGFGGSYEAVCRDMVLAGLQWLDDHPEAGPAFKEFENVYGIFADENKDGKALIAAMVKVTDGPTGAMVQATVNHVMYAHKNGWEKYVEELSKPDDAADKGD